MIIKQVSAMFRGQGRPMRDQMEVTQGVVMHRFIFN